MADDQGSSGGDERSLLLTGLGVVGGAAAIGMVIGALAGGTGLAGLMIGAGIGIVVSVAMLAGVAIRRGAEPESTDEAGRGPS
ncbi:MAG TPA: hypothetical protein VL422_15295 [Miltoncostaea sp.]|jgi:hypothetical protein|nr:hypothetical protein [Miltoncostaea sp.]